MLVGSTLFGTTARGGTDDDGTIFSINTNNNPNNTGLQVLHSFSGTDGAGLDDALTLVGSVLYGTTEIGGTDNDGTVFSINTNNFPNNTGFQVLHSFSGTDGIEPEAGLTLVNSALFGMTNEGGSAGDGTVFSINTNNNPNNAGFQVLQSFLGSNGAFANSALTLDGSNLYGTTTGGGSNGDGTVFSLNELVMTPSGTADTFTVGGSPVTVDSGVTITSTDSNLTGATVTIASPQSGDTLNFTSPTGSGISGSYSGGVLTLSGNATPIQYQAALQSITFSTSSNGLATRSLSIVVLDNSLTSGTAAESIKVAFAAPVVTPSGIANTFTLGTSAMAVDSGVTVTSSDTDITGASMTIANYQSGDSFNFTPQNGISIAGNSAGVLTLSGVATPAQYQTALQSVTFSTTSINKATRTVDVVADDSAALPTTSNAGVDTVQVAIADPVVTANQSSANATAGEMVTVDSAVTVSSFDTDVTGATILISSGFQLGDTLQFTSQNGITGYYDASTGMLTLFGFATPAQYQTALQSVTYSSISTTSTVTRTVSIFVADNNDTNGANSNTVTTQITVSAPATVGPFVQEAELVASDGAAGSGFGYSVAISGNTMVVATGTGGLAGLPEDTYPGVVYVYTEAGSSWIQTAELTPNGGAANNGFGDSVAISGDTIVVGASGTDSGQGAAYVFTESDSNWSQAAELVASGGAAGDGFGDSVSISGNTIVVGAEYVGKPSGLSLNPVGPGAAYVFTGSGAELESGRQTQCFK